MNFILGQCGRAEIQAWLLCGWHLVNTDWTDYKVTSVLQNNYKKSWVIDYCDILPKRQFLAVRRNILLLNRKIINAAVIGCIFTSERRTSLKVKYQIQKIKYPKKEPASKILNKN